MKIAKMEELLSNTRIVDESQLDTSRVYILCKVTIKNVKTGAKMSYTLVPENEADLKTGRISVNSPIAKGLLGKEVGDVTDVVVPSGTMKFEILDISR
jgi:transcription elongation factor GreA